MVYRGWDQYLLHYNNVQRRLDMHMRHIIHNSILRSRWVEGASGLRGDGMRKSLTTLNSHARMQRMSCDFLPFLRYYARAALMPDDKIAARVRKGAVFQRLNTSKAGGTTSQTLLRRRRPLSWRYSGLQGYYILPYFVFLPCILLQTLS